ncbi:MAG: hypothetical protein HOV81_38565 [Kofleriaceae bacterium]|nr:hypothetical protein [Kofleriaceae bacterium]
MKRALFCIAPLVASACVETKDPIVGTQSLKIELKSPTGDAMNPLTDYTVMVDVSALDADGEIDTSYNNQVQVYVNFLGTLTPYFGGPPLAKIQMTAGKASSQSITLPPVFGPATLWFDDGTSENPTYASGASPTLWYRDPFIDDIQRPTNEMALDALSKSPLETKQVTVNASRHGANGRLVVTSVFAQGYTVSDVLCGPGGAPPCTVAPNPAIGGETGYDHKMVFSFSAPFDERGRAVQEGEVISGFAGGVSEFNGLTEIGFPQTFVEGEVDVDPARIPAPAVMDASWFASKYMFERNEAAPIAILGGKVCDLDQDYATYKQWKLDPAGVGGNCTGNRNVINVISTGVIATDPMTLVGKTLPRVVGVLRPVNIGSFNVWIIYPRNAADLQLQ